MQQTASRAAYALLLAMTLVSFGGPLVLMLVIGGGENPKWPPDRPVEWVAFVAIVGLGAVLVLLGLSIRLWLPTLTSKRCSYHETRMPQSETGLPHARSTELE